MRFERIETQEQFEEVYKESFDGDIPLSATAFNCYDDDKRIAFCSVYVHSRWNLYLQYCGFAKGVNGTKKYGYYIEMLKQLHSMGFPFIMGAISNRNHRSLMWALRSGFQINGVRQATDGELFVEVLHTLIPDKEV